MILKMAMSKFRKTAESNINKIHEKEALQKTIVYANINYAQLPARFYDFKIIISSFFFFLSFV